MGHKEPDTTEPLSLSLFTFLPLEEGGDEDDQLGMN